MTSLVPPIKWHGGKHYLASWIISNMPPHLHYVEPFFGGGAVLLARDTERDWAQVEGEKLESARRGASEVVNDISRELSNFWKVLGDPDLFSNFRQRLDLIPFSESVWKESVEAMNSEDPIESAIGFFIRARQSRQGLMRSFATLSRTRTRRRMSEQVSSYLTAIDGLEDVHRRLQTVVVLNEDACKVIKQQDGRDTLFYCDPPYVHETRSATEAYSFEMSVAQHEELLQVLETIQGKFILSGYNCSLYEAFAIRNKWRREDKLIDNKASSSKTKEKKCESLWMNY